MSDLEWTVGQRVLLTARFDWLSRGTVEMVERVMPSGMPVVKGQTYRRNGAGRGENRNRIAPLTPEKEREIAEAARLQKARGQWEDAVDRIRKARLSADALEGLVAAAQAAMKEAGDG